MRQPDVEGRSDRAESWNGMTESIEVSIGWLFHMHGATRGCDPFAKGETDLGLTEKLRGFLSRLMAELPKIGLSGLSVEREAERTRTMVELRVGKAAAFSIVLMSGGDAGGEDTKARNAVVKASSQGLAVTEQLSTEIESE